MKRILSIILTVMCCCYMMAQQDTTTVVGRLQYVYALKNIINEHVWQGFADKKNDVPLIYYDDTCCYVVNPTEKILAKYSLVLVHSDNDVKIYQTKRIDNTPFHMHVTITDEQDKIDYRTPIMRCSSLEQTGKTIPDVTTVKEWATMVMHEYFHGFQFKQDGFFDAYERALENCPPDTLSTLQAQHEWYKESLLQENELLLKAIDAPDLDATKAHIRAFLELRDARRTRIREEQDIDITAAEQFMEIMEGSARYIEYQLYEYFGDFNLSDAKWLYTVGRNYYYATGFNLLRLLDKLGIKYHSYIFTDVTALEKDLLAGNIQASNVQILFEIRPEVNYVTHLYTLAGLGFSDDEYTVKYGNTLPKTAVDTLRKYKGYLTFGQGEGGMLAAPFFFIVSSESFANADSLQMVLKTLLADERMTSAPQDVKTAACAIAKVYADHYDDYIKTVYPRVVKDMQERQRLLTQRMQNTSLVSDWERVTGYTWNRSNYHWLLYRAGENGPSYNNLNDTANTVYYNQSIDFQLSMFSHEFGIFLMQDSIMPIFQEMKEYAGNLKTDRDLTFVPWSAYESLACWYNCKIAGGETEDYHNFEEADVKTFCQIFDRLAATGINDPAELYRKGVMEYLKEFGLEFNK